MKKTSLPLLFAALLSLTLLFSSCGKATGQTGTLPEESESIAESETTSPEETGPVLPKTVSEYFRMNC